MKEVIMYTSTTWPHCYTAKEFLSEKGIKYIEKDINSDPDSRQEMMKRKIMGVSAFIIGDEVVVGLDKARIESLIDYKIIQCIKCSTKLRTPKNKGNIVITCPKCKTKFKTRT